jgi:triosephosphate isomerase (TIM)
VSERSMLFVANWKMQFSFNETIAFCEDYLEDLITLDQTSPHQIVLCPSFTALYPLHLALRGTPIALGAQTCSSYPVGPYTGDVSAESLAQVGCSYCIVGHSERRIHCKESNEEVAAKVMLLLHAGIKPIICVGERREQYERKKTFSVLEEQLAPLFTCLQKSDNQRARIYIAYEPCWAIGTQEVASAAYLDEVFNFIAECCSRALPTMTTCSFLYGGGLNEKTLPTIAQLDWLSGFLMGSSSLDFQKFKNMVSLCT